MTQTSKPDKFAVRKLMEKHREEKRPPLSPEEFQRELGWELIEAEREAKQPR